ncbi:MAG: hypothetical protein K2L80_03035 [Muribaculaceae bacterium]|nr:hypothetical protein [Muribaculaceae bacterium]
MKIRNLIILSTAFLYGCLSTEARSLPDMQTDSLIASHKFINIDGTPVDTHSREYLDSVYNIIATFYYDQFRHFSDPAAPYFLFMSRDSQLAMGVGGAVRMRGYYDWGGAIPSPAFAPYMIPIHPDPANMRVFGTTPAGTCLFFRVIGRNKTFGEYQLYIEANFNGYQTRDFRLKKAYAMINDFTVGYAVSTFSDLAAVPPTVDANGPNNKMSMTSVLVRYMPTFKNRWTVAASLETPATQIAADNSTTRSVSSWLPDAAAFVQYQWDKSQHIRLAGILRTLSYRDIAAGKNFNKLGWGIQLSSVSHPVDPLTLYLTMSTGRGYGSLGGDLICSAYDLVPDPDKPGRLTAPASLGWCAGLQYNFTPSFFISASASQTRYFAKNEAPDEYKSGTFICVNTFYNLTPRIQLGAELDLGQRRNFGGEHRWTRRVGAVCQFSF